MKKRFILSLAIAGMFFAAAPALFAQDDAAPAGAPVAGELVDTTTGAPPAPANTSKSTASEFWEVMTGSGTFGVILWLGLFGVAGWGIYLGVECAILVRASKIMPQSLVNNVEAAMKEGDVVKALQFCDNEPGPMANILSAGFSHVEEGFEVIQEAISTAADIEVEKIMQRLTWISVVSNISPMLGLLGTVQGMILAFATLTTGAPDVGELAKYISQALWTTAAGLVVAIPSVCSYYSFRNNANRIVLRMEAITMELIKDLRNVEVVAE